MVYPTTWGIGDKEEMFIPENNAYSYSKKLRSFHVKSDLRTSIPG